jgi:hypothetical protein
MSTDRNGYQQIEADAPAFPVSVPGCGDNGWHGMSLRDWFAGMVIQGLYAGRVEGSSLQPKPDAAMAYIVADAMIAARAKVQS